MVVRFLDMLLKVVSDCDCAGLLNAQEFVGLLVFLPDFYGSLYLCSRDNGQEFSHCQWYHGTG